MSTARLDSRLDDWDSIAHRYTHALLTGNGSSLAVWPRFNYRSLYRDAPLQQRDRRLFTQLKTTNFESVLEALRTARLICRNAGHETKSVSNQYRRVRSALVRAISTVHVPWTELPSPSLRLMRDGLRHFDFVFSTNYDLLHYWTLMSEAGTGFVDYFWSDGHSFDSTNASADSARTKVLYLHGALHLYRDTHGVTRKRTAGSRNLLTALARSNDIPLFVSEGRWRDKERSIRTNDYLSFAYETFAHECRSLVVFGHALRDHDLHLRRVIKASCRRLAVAVLPGSAETIRKRKAQVLAAFPGTHRVDFFEATTHPLGDLALSIDP